ncbi:MAG: hypothetical protein WCP12_14785, partial [bacterium]
MKKITMNIAGVALASVFAAMTAAQAATGTWTGGAGATWNTSASNWSGVTGTPWDSVNGTNNIAKFNMAGAMPSVSGAVYANQLAFTNTATVSGGTITLGGVGPTITVYASGSESQIASSLAGTDFIKAGSGTLILTGNSAAGFLKGANNGGTLVLNGGTMNNSTLSNTIHVGSSTGTGSNSSVVVTGPGSLWNLNAGTLLFANMANATNYYNNVTIANGGIVTNVAGLSFTSASGTGVNAVNCSLVITNGGKLYATAGLAGKIYGGMGNSILVGTVGQTSLWDVQNSDLSFCDARWADAANNTFTIDANGMVTNALSVVIGRVWSGRNVVSNSLTVQNGGQLWITTGGLAVGKMYDGGGTLTNNMVGNTVLITGAGSQVSMTGGGVSLGVGKATYNSTNNILTIANGGLLEAVGTITVAGAVANNVSNKLTVADGGILQFTVAAPTITINNFDASSGNGMVINNGTLSFRGITSGTLPNLTNNLATSGGISTNNIVWQGRNAFRLDS